MTTKISVVVPVYNAEQYIERCLNSIFLQTFQDFEVLATDDGSTDGSLNILRSYSDRIVVLTQPNRGASSARNRGIQSATGKYIAFIDIDDCWHPAKLQIQHRLMEENPELVACYTGKTREFALLHSRVDSEASTVFSRKYLNEIFSSPYLGTSSFMVRRSVIEELGGFDESLETAEDIDLYLKVASLGAIAEVTEQLVFKARIDDSLGGKLSSYRDNLYVIDRFIRESESGHDLQASAKAMRAKIYYEWAKDLAWHGRTTESILRSSQYLRLSGTYRNFSRIIRFVVRSLIVKPR